MKRNIVLPTRITIGLLFTAITAGSWDIWWHITLGRETFWSYPHIVLYSSVIIAIVLGLFTWYKTKERIWGWIAFALLLVPLSAPFDEAWHRFFDQESAGGLLSILSPPHLSLVLGLLIGFILLLSLLKKDKDPYAQRIFGAMIFASLMGLSLFVLTPFQPAGGEGLIGFWGAGVIALALSSILLFAQRWLPGMGGMTLVILFFVLIQSVGFGTVNVSAVEINALQYPPGWLTTFSYLIPAVVIDLLYRFPIWIKGALWGFIWSFIGFGIASLWLSSGFQYSSGEILIAIFSSTSASLIAGFLLHNRKT